MTKKKKRNPIEITKLKKIIIGKKQLANRPSNGVEMSSDGQTPDPSSKGQGGPRHCPCTVFPFQSQRELRLASLAEVVLTKQLPFQGQLPFCFGPFLALNLSCATF